jgi:hypothetical protein
VYLENGSRSPSDMVMPQGPQTIPFFIFVFIASRAILRDADAKPLLFLIGGLISIVFEPIVDVLGFCYSPPEGQWIGLAVFDRDIPFFMYAVYSWFVGGQAYLFYTYFQEGRITKAGLWLLYGTLIIVNATLGLPGLLTGVYMYYRYQPFQVLGFPLWWPALNPIMPIMAGFLAHSLQPHISGLGHLIFILLVPMADGVTNGGLAWPIWVALGTDLGYWVTYPAALLTFCLAAVTIWGITTQLPEEVLLPVKRS